MYNVEDSPRKRGVVIKDQTMELEIALQITTTNDKCEPYSQNHIQIQYPHIKIIHSIVFLGIKNIYTLNI